MSIAIRKSSGNSCELPSPPLRSCVPANANFFLHPYHYFCDQALVADSHITLEEKGGGSKITQLSAMRGSTWDQQ